MELV
ncbi:Protein of unknown function [Bacillus cereus]|jgi:hypothetical protein